jgi:peptidoglycan hydrolase CwlO-like protein
MKGYMDRVNALRDQVYATQVELESRNEEVKKMQEKFEEWQDYISIFDV